MRSAGTDRFEVAMLTGTSASCLRPIRGRPVLEHQIALCKRHGFLRILLLPDDDHAVLAAQFGDGSRLGVHLGYEFGCTTRGTAGTLKRALPRLGDPVLVMHGDTLADVDLRRFLSAHPTTSAGATLLAHPTDRPEEAILVELDEQELVTAIYPAPRRSSVDISNLASKGLYVLSHADLSTAVRPDSFSDLERDALPGMVRRRTRIHGYRSPEYVNKVTSSSVRQIENDIDTGLVEHLSGRGGRRAVFLDRDGTLNVEIEHLTEPQALVLVGGAAAAVRRLNVAGYLALVVTNQSAVARGYLTLAGLKRVHAKLDELLGAEHAYLDRIYVCPHHPKQGLPGATSEFNVACACRKPGTGMVEAACRDFMIDARESWIVGDSTSDIETGRRAGLRTILVHTGKAGRDGRCSVQPDYTVADLPAAVSWILDGHVLLHQRMAPVLPAAAGARLALVGGLPQSGKSSAAQVLKEAVSRMGRTAHIIPLDSVTVPVTGPPGTTPGYDVEGMYRTIERLVDSRLGVTLDLRRQQHTERANCEHGCLLSVGPEDLLIIEGESALYLDGLRDRADVRIRVEAPEVERARRLQAHRRLREPESVTNERSGLPRSNSSPSQRRVASGIDFLVPTGSGQT